MKNYLYILCAFLLAFAGCTKDADVEPIAPAPDGNTQVVLTGFSGRGTRTGFGGAEDGAVPFLWSAGDYIWARNTRSEAIAEGGSQATFVFESLETADTYDVFYNLTGPAAATALIPAEQTQQAAGELNLGQNGDFGYATAQNGTFTLEHATSYVWFDTYSSDVTSNLLSITLSVSGGQTYLSNEAALKSFVVWTMGSLGDVTLGQLGLLLPAVVLGLVLAVAVIKPLNLLLLGENYARTMGLDIRRSRQLIFLSTTLLAGTVTAFCGPIGFIGLAVPHVARILFADADHRILVPASILTGIVVMLLCDVLAKLLTFPINTITALLGIPIVIWVVIRNKSIV